jgi:site-specific DNA-methyltransferase (adenine-specific)
MLEINKIYLGECLSLMTQIPDKSVHMILADLPYGTTDLKWDSIIPLEPLWEQYERIITDNGAIVLTSAQPFSSMLVMSNPKLFKYEWVWEKSVVGGAFDAKNKPMREHETVLVFSRGTIPTNSKNKMAYNPQGLQDTYKVCKNDKTLRSNFGGNRPGLKDEYVQTKTGYPRSILRFKNDTGLHPTQKPVALFEYLIRTYTNEGELVLDNCIGSGTTAIAAINTGRNFIGIEKEQNYFDDANERIKNHIGGI